MRCTRAGCCEQAGVARRHYSVARHLLAISKANDPTTARKQVAPGDQLLRPGAITLLGALDRRRFGADQGITSHGRQRFAAPVLEYAIQKKKTYATIIQNDRCTQRQRFQASHLVIGGVSGLRRRGHLERTQQLHRDIASPCTCEGRPETFVVRCQTTVQTGMANVIRARVQPPTCKVA